MASVNGAPSDGGIITAELRGASCVSRALVFRQCLRVLVTDQSPLCCPLAESAFSRYGQRHVNATETATMWTETQRPVVSRRWWCVVIVVLTQCALHAASVHCPKPCFCNRPSRIVYCSRRGLAAIPSNVSATSLEINLNENPFTDSALRRVNVSRFVQLERLYMNDCGIESIEVDTFIDLVNLKWLDLSKNRISEVADFTFRGLNLMHLFLNGNRNIRLYARSFQGLVTTGLYLHECALSRLAVKVLSPLNTTLRSLWLDSNELERLDKKFLSVFASLSHLRLGSNPLHCNCEVVWLKEFYDKNGDLFKGATPPSCLTPTALKGNFFDELSLFDLRCQRPVFNNIDAQLGADGGRLRCSAAGDPAPALYWVRPSGVATKYDAPLDETARSNEAILTVDTGRGGDVAGMYICLAHNEAGNVTLTLNVTWPHRKTVDTTPVAVREQTTIVSTTTTTRQVPSTPPVIPSPPQRERPRPVAPVPRDRDREKEHNFTSLNMLELGRRRQNERLFNLTELIGAVIGTHVCTLLLCLILMPIYYKRRWRHSHDSLEKKPPPSPRSDESLYLNGLGARHNIDYVDGRHSKR